MMAPKAMRKNSSMEGSSWKGKSSEDEVIYYIMTSIFEGQPPQNKGSFGF